MSAGVLESNLCFFAQADMRDYMTLEKGSERLDKAIASQTSLSRKDVHRLMSRGQILVNGVCVRSFAAKVNMEYDNVVVDGQSIQLKKYSYLMLNKPKGVVSATSDLVLPTVIDLVPQELRRKGLFPAGRLDKDTQGFVLITNDGDFAHRILSPKSHVPKVYTAQLDQPFDQSVIDAFANGVALKADKHEKADETGKSVCMPAKLEPVGGDWGVGRVVIRQGMYHQVRRMFTACGFEVVALKREQIGGLVLDPALQEGACREITEQEKRFIVQEKPE